jgi:predicted DsbA family dithiol-disulfide isomerase
MVKVEIWSDIMCPFCYIGKRNFEQAMAQFEHASQVKVIWKSFQLQPDLQTNIHTNALQHLAESKGWSIEHTKQITSNVQQMAAQVGLHFDFERAVVANTFDAHQVLHYAKSKGKSNEMEEALFKAYFTDGANLADHQTLANLAASIGLDAQEAQLMLKRGTYTQDVQMDIYESKQVGVRGVPHFVFADKYAISGAQPALMFLQVLQQIWNK